MSADAVWCDKHPGKLCSCSAIAVEVKTDKKTGEK